LNRIELKKVIYDFNSISNRLMRVDYNEYNSVLAKFLAYINETEIISDYIKDCGEPSYDVKAEIEEVIGSYGRSIFALGDTTQEEVSNIYHILKYLSDNNIDVVRSVARAYSTVNKWQEMAKEFNERVVMVFIRHIEGYLTKIGIDMGMDENIKYSISVNNGQVNLASDNATVNAILYNAIDPQKLDELVDAIKKETPCNMNKDDLETLNESLDVIRSEMIQPKPKKSLVKTALTGLQAIKGTAEFGAAIVALVQFIQSII